MNTSISKQMWHEQLTADILLILVIVCVFVLQPMVPLWATELIFFVLITIVLFRPIRGTIIWFKKCEKNIDPCIAMAGLPIIGAFPLIRSAIQKRVQEIQNQEAVQTCKKGSELIGVNFQKGLEQFMDGLTYFPNIQCVLEYGGEKEIRRLIMRIVEASASEQIRDAKKIIARKVVRISVGNFIDENEDQLSTWLYNELAGEYCVLNPKEETLDMYSFENDISKRAEYLRKSLSKDPVAVIDELLSKHNTNYAIDLQTGRISKFN